MTSESTDSVSDESSENDEISQDDISPTDATSPNGPNGNGGPDGASEEVYEDDSTYLPPVPGGIRMTAVR